MGHFISFCPRDILSEEKYLSLVGRIHAIDHIEQRGFSSPVWYNQSQDLPFGQFKGYIGKRLQAAKAFGNSLYG